MSSADSNMNQWHRSVVKYGGQSGQAIKLFQVHRKIGFTFHFWDKSFILDDAKLAELSSNSFGWKNVTFSGVKTYSDPSHIFSGVKTPSTAMIYALNMNISDERHRKCYDRDIEGDGRAVNGVRLHRRRPSLASQFAQNKQWNLWIFIMYKFQVCAPLSSRFTLH